MVSNSNTQAIIQTLAYFDIFDYPLTKEEIKKYLPITISEKEFAIGLKGKKIQQLGDYFSLVGRENIVSFRLEREKISEKKLQKARKILWSLKLIPTILYVGISGSLAMKNAQKTDDIDLFIITKPHTIWLSRLLVNSMLLIRGNLRRFSRRFTKDTICTNMWVDAQHLGFTPERQNIYTAHEIVQLFPLISKSNSSQQFLLSNIWIKKFFPNIQIDTKKANFSFPENVFLASMEWVAEKVQLIYMQKHRTTETITDGFVAFHPNDYTHDVLQKWKEQQKIWNIE